MKIDLVRRLAVVAVGAPILLSGCSTTKGNERSAQHAADQIRIVAVQREARLQEKQAEAQANTAVVEALARVAEANPQHAPSVAVALAVIGVRGADGPKDDAPVVALQQQRNEALEWAKVISPVAGGLVNTLGVAAINASVNKKQAEIGRDIQVNSQNAQVKVVEAVAGLGTAAANSVGTEVGGDYYSVTDSGSIDQGVTTTDSNNTTSTTETTTTQTSSVSLATTLNYDGNNMSLAELISQLRNAGASYSIDLDGDGSPDVEGGGDGETVTINCSDPQFSPAPPECN